MTNRGGCTVLVCGISGVGKTRLLAGVADRFPTALIWRAGEMIGEARKVFDPEELRTLPARDMRQSQELLVNGFEARRQVFADELVILDAHSVIDTDDGLFDIPVDIVMRLRPSGIIHVSDEIEKIQDRRVADFERVRPRRSLSELQEYQRRSIEVCERYQVALGVPLLPVRSGDLGAFERAIQGILVL